MDVLIRKYYSKYSKHCNRNHVSIERELIHIAESIINMSDKMDSLKDWCNEYKFNNIEDSYHSIYKYYDKDTQQKINIGMKLLYLLFNNGNEHLLHRRDKSIYLVEELKMFDIPISYPIFCPFLKLQDTIYRGIPNKINFIFDKCYISGIKNDLNLEILRMNDKRITLPISKILVLSDEKVVVNGNYEFTYGVDECGFYYKPFYYKNTLVMTEDKQLYRCTYTIVRYDIFCTLPHHKFENELWDVRKNNLWDRKTREYIFQIICVASKINIVPIDIWINNIIPYLNFLNLN